MNQNPLRSDFDSIETPAIDRRPLMTWRSVYVLGGIFCLIYIAFMYYTPLALIPIAGHDDGHFIRQGIELTRGHWIGGYSHMTLIKGPGLPIFLALSKFFGLPYSISIAAVEAGSFFLLSFVVGRLANAPGLALLMLGVLLSFPWMWSGSSLRILRDGFYTSLIFVFLALSFLTIWGEGEHRRYRALAAGLVLGLASITREENPWLWPAMGILIVALFIAERRRSGGLAAFSMIVLWAAIGLVSVRGTILTIHYAKYKTFDVADIGETNFRNALRALFSVEPSERIPHLLVSKEARSAIYAHSPTFARLSGLLDGDPAPLAGWQGPGCQWYGGKICGDYGGFWFVWAFRDAVALAGGYANAKTSAEFYRQISQEIGRACENKELTCRYSPVAEIPPLVRANFILMLGSAINVVKLVTLSTPLAAERPGSQGPADMVQSSAAFLNLPFTAPQQNDPADTIVAGANQRWMIIFTQSVQNKIRDLYNAVWPVVCAVGIAAILFSTYVRLTTTGIDRLTVITWTFLILVATRIGLLSIVDATAFPAAFTDYVNPAAYCLAAAIAIGLHSAVQNARVSLRSRREYRFEKPLPADELREDPPRLSDTPDEPRL
jgi:hypothetical protein